MKKIWQSATYLDETDALRVKETCGNAAAGLAVLAVLAVLAALAFGGVLKHHSATHVSPIVQPGGPI